MPRPGSSVTCSGKESSRPRSSASWTSASASGCAESWSSEAASRSELVGGEAPSARERRARSPGVPSVSVPVLSSSTVRASPSCSITPPPLTITPALAAREMPAIERDRSGQDQRAGRRDDEHGECAHRVAGETPGEPGDHGGQRQEDDRVAVGQPDEGRLLRLGLPHETHDRRVRALGGEPDRAQLEGLAGVGRAAADVPAAARRRPAAARRSGSTRRRRPRRSRPRRPPGSPRRRGRRPRPRPRPARPAPARPHRRAGAGSQSAAPARRATSARAAPARPAISSSALPPESISATTAPASPLLEGERAGDRDERDRVHADVAPERARRRRST